MGIYSDNVNFNLNDGKISGLSTETSVRNGAR